MDSLNDMDGVQAASAIYSALAGTRLSDKYRAAELLDKRRDDIDLKILRDFLSKAITEDFCAGKEYEREDYTISQTRMWLLGALAKIAKDDDLATKLVILHLDEKHEQYGWGRYWALEGLISENNPQAKASAKNAAKDSAKDSDTLVSMLAQTYLASLGDKSAIDEVKRALKARETQWPALRALRVVPLPAAVSTICDIVEKGDYSDEAYEAIMALGRVPSDWTHAPHCARGSTIYRENSRCTNYGVSRS